MAFTMRSPAFEDGGEIPAEHTCEGADASPPLEWSGVPAGAQSLALVVDDPDAPDPKAPRATWVHWVVFDLPPDATGLPAAVRPDERPAGARQGVNDWKRAGYGGPCPPIGRHRYFFKLYALDRKVGELQPATKASLEGAMKRHVIGEARLMGTYVKKKG